MTLHPDTHVVNTVCSSCGTALAFRSTADRLAVDVCSSCHPAYTGLARATAGGSRIDRFNRRRTLATA
ncbi:MAG: 50S ribosomal protein L31 [Gaiellaceae bacterium]